MRTNKYVSDGVERAGGREALEVRRQVPVA
jgi:hypothetical protein